MFSPFIHLPKTSCSKISLCYNVVIKKKEIKKTKLKPRKKVEAKRDQLVRLNNELQSIKVEIADLKIIFKDRVELKRVIRVEKEVVRMQKQVDIMMAQK